MSDTATEPCRHQHPRASRKPVPPGTVSVGRPSRWGNPYRVGIDGTAEACVRLFEACYQEDAAYQAAVKTALRGKSLMCWCTPGAPCHGEVLLRWAKQA